MSGGMEFLLVTALVNLMMGVTSMRSIALLEKSQGLGEPSLVELVGIHEFLGN